MFPSNPFFPLKIPLGLRPPAAKQLRKRKTGRRCVFSSFLRRGDGDVVSIFSTPECIGEIVGKLRTREYG